ncbi:MULTISPECIES: 50S ribosomal protein L1 [Aerococcus]|uniref:Large ribosomal subunit protein uL1 n=1 Tax=Aerococcus tenax TaxID=3078812 RepID=A0A329PG17_9LACT|nr:MULTISPECIES: 50S ribosomal protein L1 [Aerococcus]KAA9234197.1 50S ribosomal protein L1 [Aerococcus mictus]KAA9241989.1 50S ribosomal protein L1 [Aerococcus urinae]KAA9299097.1 50S ribosomal protein L1 [Aerococcus tenax]MDK6292490.1 50S ribosomal protein L1 [Aerococcus urinae]MDK6375182.1 50S ribosomal protein L1 [Aerococcus urinae]
MAKQSKKLKAAYEKIDANKKYDAKEAIELLKDIDFANFDASFEVSYRLGIEVKKNDQQIRGAMVLPKGTGKSQTVLVFAQGEKAQEAKDAGADYVGDDDLVQKINDGWMDFDVVVATPDMMGKIGRLGRVLGPKGLMPNPKTGTVTQDVTKAVNDIKAGQIEYRADNGGNVHTLIGKVSFSTEDLLENFKAIHDTLVREKPAAAKGRYIRNLVITTTMGPGIQVDPSSIGEDI